MVPQQVFLPSLSSKQNAYSKTSVKDPSTTKATEHKPVIKVLDRRARIPVCHAAGEESYTG